MSIGLLLITSSLWFFLWFGLLPTTHSCHRRLDITGYFEVVLIETVALALRSFIQAKLFHRVGMGTVAVLGIIVDKLLHALLALVAQFQVEVS